MSPGTAVALFFDYCRQDNQSVCDPPQESQLDGRSFRCRGFDCRANVPYRRLRRGVWYCKGCTLVCIECKETVYGDQRATGIYEGCCIDCTRCEECNIPMWDYACGTCLFR